MDFKIVRCDMQTMTIKPILFSTEMVRAILEGLKTVTRRVVKFPRGWNPKFTGYIPDGVVLYGSNNIPAVKAPYQPGDILWVRETWSISDGAYLYRAFPGVGMEPEKQDAAMREMELKWNPSIHMPREAARIFLRVTEVRAERLQDINLDPPGPENQVIREGLRRLCDFIAVWEITIKPANRPLYGWDANPWVWVIEFERCERPEGWPR